MIMFYINNLVCILLPFCLQVSSGHIGSLRAWEAPAPGPRKPLHIPYFCLWTHSCVHRAELNFSLCRASDISADIYMWWWEARCLIKGDWAQGSQHQVLTLSGHIQSISNTRIFFCSSCLHHCHLTKEPIFSSGQPQWRFNSPPWPMVWSELVSAKICVKIWFAVDNCGEVRETCITCD